MAKSKEEGCYGGEREKLRNEKRKNMNVVKRKEKESCSSRKRRITVAKRKEKNEEGRER